MFFCVAVVLLGMAVPVTFVIVNLVVGLEGGNLTFLYTAILSGLIGDLAMRYRVLRCGLYDPLIPSRDYR